jgi:hypothetical protein
MLLKLFLLAFTFFASPQARASSDDSSSAISDDLAWKKSKEEKQEAQDQVVGCGGGGFPPGAQAIQLQFRNQLRLNIAKDWKW